MGILYHGLWRHRMIASPRTMRVRNARGRLTTVFSYLAFWQRTMSRPRRNEIRHDSLDLRKQLSRLASHGIIEIHPQNQSQKDADHKLRHLAYSRLSIPFYNFTTPDQSDAAMPGATLRQSHAEGKSDGDGNIRHAIPATAIATPYGTPRSNRALPRI